MSINGNRVVHHHHYYGPEPAERSGAIAAVLELIPGLFIQTFGIGHFYAGEVGLGLLLMFGYWFVLGVNVFLCFFVIGFITLPICWVGMMIAAPLMAASACRSS